MYRNVPNSFSAEKMSDTQNHFSQAVHNETLAASLLSKLTYKDWLITVSFYSALHYVEAKLASRTPPIHPASDVPKDPKTGRPRCSPHIYRDQLVELHYNKIFGDYRFLRVKSEESRYQCFKNSFSDKLAKDCFQRHLKNIKDYFGLS